MALSNQLKIQMAHLHKKWHKNYIYMGKWTDSNMKGNKYMQIFVQSIFANWNTAFSLVYQQRGIKKRKRMKKRGSVGVGEIGTFMK